MAGPRIETSPFIYDGPLPPDHVVGRETEVELICDRARAGRFLCLYAPRRFGKTSLLGRVAAQLWETERLPVILVDLYSVVSLADLVVRMEQAYRNHAHGGFRTAVERLMAGSELGLSLAGGGISVSLARQPALDPLPALHSLLDLPVRVAGRHESGHVLVVLDEFQSIGVIEGAEGILRSHIQHQREHASYVFAGSEQGLLQAVFADRARPLYGQAEQLRLGRLPAEALAAAIEDGFAASGRSAGGMIAELLATAEGHPQRAMFLAHHLWEATAPRGTADEDSWSTALAAAMSHAAPEFDMLWARLSANQQRVLRALRRLGSPFRTDAVRLLELPRGSAQKTLRSLIAASVLEQDDESVRFVDPLLARWADRRFPGP